MSVLLRLCLPLLVLGLAGCDPSTMAGMQTPGTVLQAPDPARYGASEDGGHTVKAIPVEKVDPAFLRQEVVYHSDEAPGTIIIDPTAKHLYLITAPNLALRYGISVGKEGFGWSGSAEVTGRAAWPKWTPPPEMIARRPELERYRDGQAGGPTNPLGARALYLKTNGVDYGYRIHGTPEWESIGHNASSGCFRMFNQDIIDLTSKVQNGAKVIVLTAEGKMPEALDLPS